MVDEEPWRGVVEDYLYKPLSQCEDLEAIVHFYDYADPLFRYTRDYECDFWSDLQMIKKGYELAAVNFHGGLTANQTCCICGGGKRTRPCDDGFSGNRTVEGQDPAYIDITSCVAVAR